MLELWQRTRMDWGFVTDRLATAFRKETWIGSHERRFVSETLYGLVRHLRRIDAALARGRRTERAPRDLERLLALLVLERLIEPARAASACGELDWNAVAGIDEVIARERKPVPRIALAASLPDWLAARLVADWGDQAEALALALNRRAPMTVRANLLIGDRDALAAELGRERLATTPGAWCDTALHVETRTNLFALPAFTRGAMEAQDEGSQLLADLAAACGRGGAAACGRGGAAACGPAGGVAAGAGGPAGAPPRAAPGLVIDLCAGAGGKTLAIAARLGNRGRIVAADVDAHKLEELRRRARRAGVSSAQAVHLDGGAWPAALDALRGKADVVLVDAPCSGIGALRRNPEARWRLREADLAGFAARQKEILVRRPRAARAGRPAGVRDVHAARGRERRGRRPRWSGRSSRRCRSPRSWANGRGSSAMVDAFTVTPHRHGTDGFYARVMRRV